MSGKKTLYIGLAAILTFTFFVLLAQSYFRFGSTNTNDAKTAQSATTIPRPTSSANAYVPYINTLLTPAPFDTITLTFTSEGVSVDGDSTKVTVDDVISIINQDVKKHSVRIQDKELMLEPGSAHGYPVSATNDSKITVVLDGNVNNTYIYEIQ